MTVADDGHTAEARWRAFIQFCDYGGEAHWAEESRPRNPVSEECPPDARPTCDHATLPHYSIPPFHCENPGNG